jgi:hypothetical protein
MNLCRITKHVKEQNWFAVGLDFELSGSEHDIPSLH